ncbi:MAG: carbohydrate kinase [Bauldia sp.]|nr:carbohydrate kinase [Bauldia sp.]
MSPPGRRIDVVAFGELVIDLIPAGQDGGEPLYAARPGGAPGNVAAGVARLGLTAAMLTKVGREPFGDLAVRALATAGVRTDAIRRAGIETTALAVVALDANGDRDFALYRANCADASYARDEVDTALIRDARLLHVGSLSLATPISGAAQRHAVAVARAAGLLVAADPNLRPAVWADKRAMADAGREAVASADIVKLSVEELAILSGTDDPADGVRRLWHPRLQVMAVTDGARGARIHTAGDVVEIGGFAVEVVDTVGCGDAFLASLLAGLLEGGLDGLGRDRLLAIGQRACAAGAVMATRTGAMTRMPRADEIDLLMTGRHGEGP